MHVSTKCDLYGENFIFPTMICFLEFGTIFDLSKIVFSYLSPDRIPANEKFQRRIILKSFKAILHLCRCCCVGEFFENINDIKNSVKIKTTVKINTLNFLFNHIKVQQSGSYFILPYIVKSCEGY